MKILLTGATGFLGSAILQSLLENGYQVLAHTRRTHPILAHPQLTWIEGEINSAHFWLDTLPGVDGVIHAAALVSFAKHRYDDLLTSNVEPTAHLINGLISLHQSGHPPIKLIHISSISAITGERHQTSPLDGQSKTDPDLLTSSYGLSKYLAELEVYRGIEEGISATILNPGFILGRGNYAKGSTSIFGYVVKRKPFFTRGTLNYVDIRDVCNAVLSSITAPAEGKRFLLCGGQITYEGFFNLIAKKLGIRPPSIHIPPAVSHFLASITEVVGRLIPLPELLSADSLRAAQRTSICSGQHASDALGIQYYSLEDSLKWVIADPNFPKG